MAMRGKTSLGDKIISANPDCEFRCIIRPAARYSSAEVTFPGAVWIWHHGGIKAETGTLPPQNATHLWDRTNQKKKKKMEREAEQSKAADPCAKRVCSSWMLWNCPFLNNNFHLSLQSTKPKYLGAGWMHSKHISLLMVSSGLVFASCSKARLQGIVFFF